MLLNCSNSFISICHLTKKYWKCSEPPQVNFIYVSKIYLCSNKIKQNKRSELFEIYQIRQIKKKLF